MDGLKNMIKARHSRTHLAKFHLCKMCRTDKAGARGRWRTTVDCYGVSFCGDEMFCNFGKWLVLHILINILNITETVYFKIMNFMVCKLYLNFKFFS